MLAHAEQQPSVQRPLGRPTNVSKVWPGLDSNAISLAAVPHMLSSQGDKLCHWEMSEMWGGFICGHKLFIGLSHQDNCKTPARATSSSKPEAFK